MKLEAFLQERGSGYEKHAHPLAYTAQELANAEHVSGYLVAKPVVVKGAAGYTMCVLAAPKRVDLKRVADVLGEPSVRLASESEMTSLFPDCEIGAEPPFGSQYGVQTFVDETMTAVQQIVFRAGTHARTVKMSCADYLRLEKAKVGAFVIENE